MKNAVLVQRVRRLRGWLRDRRDRGFTLLELLISVLIGAIITIGLLTLVVSLTQTNQTDTARSETQRDMQAAIDYMAQDVREAVYVYNGYCLTGTGSALNANNFASECPGVLNYLPSGLNDADTTTVLAFWKSEPLPDGMKRYCQAAAAAVNATNSSNASPQALDPKNPLWMVENQGVPCKANASYTLVVYALDTSNTGSIWKGRARLVRYRLSQFQDAAAPAAAFNSLSTVAAAVDAAETRGWANPQALLTSKFTQWPFWQDPNQNNAIVNGQAVAPTFANTGNPVVLVDFVDDRGVLDASGTPVDPGVNNPNCLPHTSATITGSADPTVFSVLTPTTAGNRAFYACVTGGSPRQDGSSVVNQQVFLSLVGSVSGRPGFPLTTAANSEIARARLTPLQTRALVRGVIQKNPGSS